MNFDKGLDSHKIFFGSQKNIVTYKEFPMSKEDTINDYPLSSHHNDGKSQYGGRDCVGYGANPPDPKWPNGAKVSMSRSMR